MQIVHFHNRLKVELGKKSEIFYYRERILKLVELQRLLVKFCKIRKKLLALRSFKILYIFVLRA